MAQWQQRLLALLLVAGVAWAGSDRTYSKGDSIELYANKIGPFANPT